MNLSNFEPLPMPADDTERRGRGRPRDPARLARILAAAREHFAEAGFDKGSVDRIALAAEVSKVTLYKYFPSKEALFNAVVNEPIRQAFELDITSLDPANPGAALAQVADTYLALITTPEILEHVRVLYASVAASPSLGRDFFESGPEAVLLGLVAYLKAACAHHTLVIANVPQAAEQFLAMVRGNEQVRLLMGQAPLRARAARQKYCRSCVALFLRGYAP